MAEQVGEDLLLAALYVTIIKHSVVHAWSDSVQVEGTLPSHQMTDCVGDKAVLALKLGLNHAQINSPFNAFEGSCLETVQITIVLAQVQVSCLKCVAIEPWSFAFEGQMSE